MRVATAALALAAAGCLDAAATFHCDDAHACDSGRMCVGGLCAQPDSSCPSKLRWDDSAGPQSGQCAVAPDMSVSDPNCGNGVLDPNETCDPGMGSPQPCPTPADCDDGNPCTDDVLVPPGDVCRQICAHTYLKDGVACPVGDGGVPGVCYKQACCTGCWNGSECKSGGSLDHCGAGGAACADCRVDGGGCEVAECNAGACSAAKATDGTQCPGGTCHGGACCDGCIADGGVCAPGTAPSVCGAGGGLCANCMNGCDAVDGGAGGHCHLCQKTCPPNSCGDDGCGGKCGTCPANQFCNAQNTCQCAGNVENNDTLCADNVDNDCNGATDCADKACAYKRCMQSGAFCNGNQKCVAGCRIPNGMGGFFIFPDGTTNPLNSCQKCVAATNDSAWTSVADGQQQCKDQNGRDGICYGGSCCGGCWDGMACHNSTGASYCGTAGGACKKCDNSQPICNPASCTMGQCQNQRANDGTKCGSPTSCGMTNGCASATFGPGCVNGSCAVMPLVQYTCCASMAELCCASILNNSSTCIAAGGQCP